jgi:predicted nicotinamide N-methyase
LSVVHRSRRAIDPAQDEWGQLESHLRAQFDLMHGATDWAGYTLDIIRPKSVDDLISEEDFNRDGRLPYWADIWPSALGLAERVVKEQGDGRRLLELGCGVGFVSCLALKVGFQVTATDYYPEACDFTRLNARRNGLSVPETRVVDWRDYPADLKGFEVVIASDVLYERTYCDLVASCFAQSLVGDGLGILTDPQRTLAAGFPVACERRGLRIVKQTTMQVEREGQRQVIDLYELRRVN